MIELCDDDCLVPVPVPAAVVFAADVAVIDAVGEEDEKVEEAEEAGVALLPCLMPEEDV